MTMDFSDEPAHSSKLLVRDAQPFNAEPDVEVLVSHEQTPEDLIFCRNHCPIKALDADDFQLVIDGAVENEVILDLEEIKAMPYTSVVAAMQCAGNRRKFMALKKQRDVEGLKWEESAICNAQWGGVKLRDLLNIAGVNGASDKMHVCFGSHVTACQEDEWYGSSIPLTKVMDESGDVILAYEMNGEPLTPARGYPFRVVIPGYFGARWCKWVDTITVSPTESPNFYQQKDYKVLPAKVDTHDMANAENWWSKLPALQSNVLNSVIAHVTKRSSSGSSGRNMLNVRGYAVGGAAGGQVKKVEVSTDRGETWTIANITYQDGRWSWTLWSAEVEVDNRNAAEKTGSILILSRATDEAGTTQLADVDWNLRGVAFNPYGELHYSVEGENH